MVDYPDNSVDAMQWCIVNVNDKELDKIPIGKFLFVMYHAGCFVVLFILFLAVRTGSVQTLLVFITFLLAINKF